MASSGEMTDQTKAVPWRERAIVYTVVYATLYGMVGVEASLLWRWFLTPLGMPVVGVLHAVGIALAIGAVTPAPRIESTVGVEVTGRAKRMAVRLAVGALIALWMRR